VVDGLVVVDKPEGPTSHDVVARCRRIFGQRRVGHAGTLDPPATGILLVGLGRATRLMRFLTELPKTYEGEVVLGVETDTLDSTGQVTASFDMAAVTADDVRRAARGFVGPIDQLPPMVSAVKVGGRRLYQLARSGATVERSTRRVTVHRFDVSEGDEPGVYRVEVECSSGTYVRALAADLGAALGGGAHLRRLRRTAVGAFTLDRAWSLADIEGRDDPGAAVLSPALAVAGLEQVSVDDATGRAVAYGKVLGRASLGAAGDGPWALVDGAGNLLAVYENHPADADAVKPSVVLAGSE